MRRWIALGTVLFWLMIGAVLVRAETSPMGNVLSGGYKDVSIKASVDTLYTTSNHTQDAVVGQNITVYSKGKSYAGVIAAEAATYIVVSAAGAWSTDTDAFFEIANRAMIINDPDGHTLYYVDSAGDSHWLDASGNETMGIDVSARQVQIGDKVRLPVQATLPDTTGFIGGEMWLSAVGDTVYHYLTNHTINQLTTTPPNEYAIAQLDSATIYIPITGSLQQLTNVGKNMFAGTELEGITVVGDSLITANIEHKRVRASISFTSEGNNKTYTFSLATNGGTVIANSPPFESDSNALPQTAILMGHWAPSAVGDALYITVNGGDATDIILTDLFAEASKTGH